MDKEHIIIKGIVCDNAKVNVATVKLLNGGDDGLSVQKVDHKVALLRCVCHTMDLVLMDFCKKFDVKS